jgi:hypothetical protein
MPEVPLTEAAEAIKRQVDEAVKILRRAHAGNRSVTSAQVQAAEHVLATFEAAWRASQEIS